MINLTGQIVLITGASRGIGRAIAELLGKAGATVIGTATSEAGAKAISGYFLDKSIKGQGIILNVTEQPSVTSAIEIITEKYGIIDILINNAGITRDNLLLRMKEKEWTDIVDTNLTSVYRLSKICLRGMIKARKGRIISISSVVGATGNPGQTNYSAAKAGVVALSKSLAQEVGSRGITVNIVAPGFISTDMTHNLSSDQRSEFLEHIPLNKPGSAEDVANAVLFLASDMANYISGETLHVNGGLYMA